MEKVLTNSVVTTVDPLDDPRWDAFVEGHPSGWVCHLSGWKKVLENSFRHINGHCFAIVRDGEIRAGLPVYEVRSWLTGNRLVSVPIATIFDPLVSSDDDLALLVEAVMGFSRERGLGAIEIRTLDSGHRFRDVPLCEGECYKHHYITLDRPPDELMKTFHRTCVRQRITRAIKSGIEVSKGDRVSDLRDFYRLYVQNRKRLGLPPQPYVFIKSLMEEFGPKGRAELTIGRKNGKPVGALLVFKFRERVSAEYAVYDEGCLNASPIHLMFWEAIRSASDEGYRIFDFGRTSPLNSSLMEFKGRWGTKLMDMPSYRLQPPGQAGSQIGRENTLSYRLMRNVCRNAPEFALGLIGDFCYRHLG